jgi:RNA polymerase sigma-70 factor, ECF subfamily
MGNPADSAGTEGPGEATPPSGGEPSGAAAALGIEQVIALHHRAVYRYAFRLTGVVADAEDLTQQAFLIAQRKLDQVRDPAKADRWLFAVVRSCFLKNRRRRRPTTAANLDLAMEEIAVEPPENDAVDRELLDRALDQLPDQYRLIVIMYYFEEFSYKQIAQELEVPIGTVMSRLARAKQRLRQQLAAHDAAPT